jgi:hypothetical protein
MFPTQNARGETCIQYQFRIVRRLPPDQYLVQFFSFIDGSPAELKAYSENFLLGDDVKLYPNHVDWDNAAEHNSETRRTRRAYIKREAVD